jgi:hypothetical protein
MRKIFTLVAFLFFTMFVAKAQPDIDGAGKKQETIKALYVAFITRELNLTSTEAQSFWPLHTEFENDVKNIKRGLPELERQQEVLNVRKKYHERFVKILGSDRTEKFYKANTTFKQKLLEQIKKRRENGTNPPPRPGRRFNNPPN